jgi:putative hydrolase of the HAD superfamily
VIEPLEAVVFDLDGTLTEFVAHEEAVWLDAGALLHRRVPGIDPSELRRRYQALAPAHYDRYARGETDLHGYWHARLTEAIAPWSPLDDDLFADYAAIKRRVIDEVPCRDGAAEVLAELRRRGLRLGLLTNGGGEMQRRKLEALGLGGAFDVVVISGETGTAKPDPAIYAGIVGALGRPSERTAMIGDDLVNDVEGSLAAGFGRAVWIDSGAAPLPAGATRAGTLAEVPAALGLER